MSDPVFDTLRRDLEADVRQPSFEVIRARRVRRTRRLAVVAAVAAVALLATTGTALSVARRTGRDLAGRVWAPVVTGASASGAAASQSAGATSSPPVTAGPTTTRRPAATSTTRTGGCAPPAFPTAECTGVPAGTALTVVTGDMTVRTANTVVDGKDIRGCVEVRAPGVVIRRSKVSCVNSVVVASFGGAYSGAGLVIEDTEITCGNGRGTAVGDTNVTARRVDIHGCENGFDVDTDVVVQDSYIHDLYSDAEAHTDGIQFAIGRNVTVTHNTIYANSGTSAIITHPTTTANVVISGNLLAGGAYTLYCPRDTSTNVRVLDNRFSRKFHPKVGAFGPWTECGKVAERRGNVYAETGEPLEP